MAAPVTGNWNTLIGYRASLPSASGNHQVAIGSSLDTTYIGGTNALTANSGSVTVGANTAMSVYGSSTFYNNVTVCGTFTATNVVIDIPGITISLSGEITVSGITVGNDATIGNLLTTSGLQVNNNANVAKSLSVYNDLNVSGPTSFGSAVGVGGLLSAIGGITLSTALTVVNGPGSVNQYLTSSGPGQAPQWTTAPFGNYLPLTGGTLTGATTVCGAFTVSGAATTLYTLNTISGVSVGGSLTVSGYLYDSMGASGQPGQVLTASGTGVAWANATALVAPKLITSDYNIQQPLSSIYTLSGSGPDNLNVTLPSAGSSPGASIVLKAINSVSGNIYGSIVPLGNITTTYGIIMGPGDFGQYISDGQNWYVSQAYPSASLTVKGIAPAYGSIDGGTSVTITGTNFLGATAVSVSGAVRTFQIVDGTTITAITNSGDAGPADVSVTTPAGTGIGTGLYTYGTAPTVTGILPTYGSIDGGTSVTITGTDFLGATDVLIGVNRATINTISGTQITAVTPSGNVGPADVSVTTPFGNGTGGGLYTYGPTVSGMVHRHMGQ